MVLFLFFTLASVVAALYEKDKIRYPRFLPTYIKAGALVAILWGVSISRLDVMNGGNITVYLTFLFILSGVVVIKPIFSLIIFWMGHLSLIFSVQTYTSYTEILINSSIFLVFAWVVSRQHYLLIQQKFSRSLLIEHKNQILEKQNKELARLTMTDHLTGLYNRYSLDDILAKKWLEAYVNQVPLLAMMVDVDYFKQINDEHGHLMGDKSLTSVADALASYVVPYQGFAFRYGGDEFCLLFYNPRNMDGILKGLENLSHEIKVEGDQGQVPIHLTIGYRVLIPKGLEDSWSLIDQADQALYKAKAKRGRRSSDIE